MKSLWILFGLLSVAGCEQSKVVENGPFTVTWDEGPLACLAKMEAAMRAMEPFAPQFDGQIFTEPGPVPATMYREAINAAKQWESTKRECWRRP